MKAVLSVGLLAILVGTVGCVHYGPATSPYYTSYYNTYDSSRNCYYHPGYGGYGYGYGRGSGFGRGGGGGREHHGGGHEHHSGGGGHHGGGHEHHHDSGHSHHK